MVSGVPLLGLHDIYAHYRCLVYDTVWPRDLVLKLDTFNEAEGGHTNLDNCGLEMATVVNLEIDRQTIAKAKRNKHNLRAVRGTILRLPFVSNRFDVVIDLSTIDHVHPCRAPDAVQEYWRVLKPGGTLLMVAWYADTLDRKPQLGPPVQQTYFLHETTMAAAWALGWREIGFGQFHRWKDVYLLSTKAKKESAMDAQLTEASRARAGGGQPTCPSCGSVDMEVTEGDGLDGMDEFYCGVCHEYSVHPHLANTEGNHE